MFSSADGTEPQRSGQCTKRTEASPPKSAGASQFGAYREPSPLPRTRRNGLGDARDDQGFREPGIDARDEQGSPLHQFLVPEITTPLTSREFSMQVQGLALCSVGTTFGRVFSTRLCF
ncbi:uncharacterized protein [Physcomitrium patens]|uniref:uncharacterized protein n=1 Tax=Physcomitrium patens TaxID=3218 RepID=UPI003CCE29BD